MAKEYQKKDLTYAKLAVGNRKATFVCVVPFVDPETGEVTHETLWEVGLTPGLQQTNFLQSHMPHGSSFLLEGDVTLLERDRVVTPVRQHVQRPEGMFKTGANEDFKPTASSAEERRAMNIYNKLQKENDRAEKLAREERKRKRDAREARKEEQQREEAERKAEEAEEAKRQAKREADEKAAAEAAAAKAE